MTNNAGGPNRKYEITINGSAQNLNGSFNDTVIMNASKLWGPYVIFPGETHTLAVNEVNGAAPSCTWVVTVANDGETFECEYTPTGSSGGGGGGPWNWRSTVRNDSLYDQVYESFIDGQAIGPVTVPPGEEHEFNFNSPDAEPPDIEIRRTDRWYDSDGNPIEGPSFVVDSVGGGSGGGGWTGSGGTAPPNPVSDNVDLPDTPLPGSWTQNGDFLTVFPPGTTPATDESIRQGFEQSTRSLLEGQRRVENETRANRGAINQVRDEVSSGFLNLDGQMTQVNQKLTQLNNAATQQSTDLQGLRNDVTSGFGDQAAKFDSLQSSLASIDTSNAQARDALNDVKTNLEAVITKIESGNQVSTNVLTELNAQGLVINEMRDGINLMTPDLDGIRATVDLIDDKLGGNIQTRLNQIEGNTANAANSLSDATDKLEQIRLNTQRTDSNTAQANTTLSEIETAVDQVENLLAGLDASVQGVGNSVDNLLPPLLSIRDNTSDLVGLNTDIRDRASEIKDGVDVLTNAVGLLQDLTNITDRIRTNTEPLGIGVDAFTNGFGAIHAPYGDVVSGAWGDAGNAWSNEAAQVSQVAPLASDDFQVTVGGVYTIDLNPFSTSEGNAIAVWVRRLSLWAMKIAFTMALYRMAMDAWDSTMSTASTASGHNPIVAIAISLIVTAVFVAFFFWGAQIIAALDVFCASIFGGAPTDPFFSTVPVVGKGLSLADKIIPIREGVLAALGIISTFLFLRGSVVGYQIAKKVLPL